LDAGPCARYVTSTGRATAEDATQIFGGRSVTQSGMGKLIENVRWHATIYFKVCAKGDCDPSTIARRRTTRSLEVPRMCWATSVCGRLSGNCQKTLVYELVRATLQKLSLDTECRAVFVNTLLSIRVYIVIHTLFLSISSRTLNARVGVPDEIHFVMDQIFSSCGPYPLASICLSNFDQLCHTQPTRTCTKLKKVQTIQASNIETSPLL